MSRFRDFLRSISSSKGGGTIGIRQSDWTVRGPSLVKKWGILGVLNTGDELTVLVDITFSRSTLTGQIDPHAFIFLQPNTFVEAEGFITLQVAPSEALVEYPFSIAKMGVAEDDSVIVSTMEREAAEGIFGTLAEMKPFRILMLAESETLFNMTLPNDANEFSETAKLAVANLR